MSHTIRDKKKLLDRVRRIRGQVEAVERALGQERGCSEVLRLIAATRGAMNALMYQVLDGHVRVHLLDPGRHPTSERAGAARELLEVVKAYLR